MCGVTITITTLYSVNSTIMLDDADYTIEGDSIHLNIPHEVITRGRRYNFTVEAYNNAGIGISSFILSTCSVERTNFVQY